MVDNQSALRVLKNPEHHGRMNHIDVKYHWVCDSVNLSLVQLLSNTALPSDSNHLERHCIEGGTRVFQSLSILSSFAPEGPIPPHDYLDDLESFFFVLLSMFLMYTPDGGCVSSKKLGPSIVLSWDDPDVSTANTNNIVKDMWGMTCLALYEKFLNLICDLATDKLDLLYPDEDNDLAKIRGRPVDGDVLQPLLSQWDDHYAQVLRLFDNTIDSINASVTPTAPVPSPSPSNHSPPIVPLNPNGSKSLHKSTRIRNLCNTLPPTPPQAQQS
ncbi:hypothetical protein FA13DRAFT_1799175 [Coprinellus micaceus]|uniref:Fungal-type protein kinase domain-containing protein n=1 Tax=Coprinellus micaceus TaxID=71717 RepID=A0A4Y7SLC8_COPMI|nr:hypothetical protein FA13DRAFT_1799175 [Coprinellus micaceus]